MQFYPHRTVEEQAERLPSSYQESYLNSKLDRIEIDGCEIHGYFEYSFMEEKSYMEQPLRSQDGSIENLDDYTTFLTPRLIIKYNMMNIQDYRTLMTFLKSKNTFNVTCYDIVADRRVTHEMYFANPQMPVIYQRYLAALGVQDYTIELIGTNKKVDVYVRFFVGKNEHEARQGQTWISWVLENSDIGYRVQYSTQINSFIVTYEDSKAVALGENFVSPHDYIETDTTYTLVSVSK